MEEAIPTVATGTMPLVCKRKILAFITIVTSMLFIDKILGYVFPDFAYIAVITLLFLISSYSMIFYMLCFLFPLLFLFSSIAYLWIAVLAVLSIKSILKSDHTQKKNTIQFYRVGLIAFFVLWEYNAHRLYGLSDINRMGGYMLTIALFLYLLYENNVDLCYKDCVNYYINGSFALCFLFLLNSFMHSPGDWLSLLSSGALRFGATVSSQFEDMTIALNANSLAYYSIVGIACCMVLIEDYKKMDRAKKIMFFAQLFLLIITGLLTVSRSWLFCMFIILGMYLSTLKNGMRFLLILLAISLLILLFFTFNREIAIVNAFVARFEQDDVTTGAGRTDIFNEYWQLFFANQSYLLYGTGAIDYVDVTNMWQSMHSGFQQIIICLGVPCSIFFILTLAKPIISESGNNKIPLPYWLPLVSVILFTQSIQFLNPTLFVFPYLLGLYALRIPKQTEADFCPEEQNPQKQSLSQSILPI